MKRYVKQECRMSIPKWRLYLNAIICVIGILFALPNILSVNVLDKLPSIFPKEKVPLGLDLQGGSHLLLEMDTNVIGKAYYERIIDAVKKILDEYGQEVTYKEIVGNEKEVILTVNDKVAAQALLKMQNIDKGVNIFHSNGRDGMDDITVKIKDDVLDAKYDDALNKTMEIVRKRIDEQGTKELSIQKSGKSRIVLQMPGVQNPEYVKNLLGRTAKMTFHIVDDKLPDVAEGEHKKMSLRSVYLPMSVRGKAGRFYTAVYKKAVVNGANLIDAHVDYGQNGEVVVAFKFNDVGTEEFAVATRKNIGKRLAIVLDNQIISAPNIQTSIPGGSGIITGNFSLEEANDLAILLRSGALPAPLHTVEEKIVGPDLGSDSIKAGIFATVLAVICIMAFMFAEYRIFGLAANIALLFNLIFLIACMSVMQATLTLPGLAGIALTLGMAVDANVLINERIREEVRKGTKVLAALDLGYKKAMGTIIDSNLTTVFGAIALYFCGSGSVKGFAVTLILGIGISMFTAISLTKCLKVLYFANKKTTEIQIP